MRMQHPSGRVGKIHFPPEQARRRSGASFASSHARITLALRACTPSKP
jgi:hypothetical protein